MRSPEITGQSYQDILENQGIDPSTVGPDDYFFTRSSILDGIDVEGLGEWYAIPRRLSVENPFTGEVETGTLRENGAFVSDEGEIADYGVQIDSRVVVLGASKIEDARLRKGAVIHAAEVSDADIGQTIAYTDIDRHENTVIHKGASVRGTPQSFRGERGRIKPVWIGDGVVVGEAASVSGESQVFPDCELEAGALVSDSLLLSGTKVASPNPEDASRMRDEFREAWTVVARSVIGDRTTIGANAQIENSTIRRNATVGARADLENVTVDDYEVVPEGTVRILKKTIDAIRPYAIESGEADNNPQDTSPVPSRPLFRRMIDSISGNLRGTPWI